jgi:hypothetical protein
MARFALIFLLSFPTGLPALAQDALPETPPELRDFRLDPERAQPQPEPEQQPQTTLPPAVPTQPQSQPPSNAQLRPATAERRVPAPNRSAAPVDQAPPEALQSDTLQPTELAPIAEPESAPAEPTATTSPEQQADGWAWWQIAAIVAVAALALFGFVLFRRRRKSESRGNAVSASAADDGAAAPVKTAAPPAAMSPPRVPAERATLTLEFIPDTATLTFTALTVKGQLRLVNTGELPVRNMRLRATLLSANRQQAEMLSAFHSGALAVSEEALGDAKAGERIAMDIEMSVPVAELQSFEVQNRRIMVPVMAANLAYEWDGGSDAIKLACLVGKEAQPPAPKMAPFRIDLGPRSFTPLGQRPLYT